MIIEMKQQKDKGFALQITQGFDRQREPDTFVFYSLDAAISHVASSIQGTYSTPPLLGVNVSSL